MMCSYRSWMEKDASFHVSPVYFNCQQLPMATPEPRFDSSLLTKPEGFSPGLGCRYHQWISPWDVGLSNRRLQRCSGLFWGVQQCPCPWMTWRWRMSAWCLALLRTGCVWKEKAWVVWASIVRMFSSLGESRQSLESTMKPSCEVLICDYVANVCGSRWLSLEAGLTVTVDTYPGPHSLLTHPPWAPCRSLPLYWLPTASSFKHS